VQDDRSTPARSPRRGRPRSFDLDAATAAALRTLWTKGYEATTVEDLAEATGLSASSLYAAFGSKHGVLQAALARYDRDRDELLGSLEHGTAGLDDLYGFLDRVRRGVTEPGSPGCFMVNTATEVAPRDERIADHAHRYRERVRDGIAAALRRALDRGELPHMGPEEILGRARLLQAALYGAQVAARSGASQEALHTVGALERQIEQWATASSPARPATGS
jgi:AcrR family transcriptional regulator